MTGQEHREQHDQSKPPCATTKQHDDGGNERVRTVPPITATFRPENPNKGDPLCLGPGGCYSEWLTGPAPKQRVRRRRRNKKLKCKGEQVERENGQNRIAARNSVPFWLKCVAAIMAAFALIESIVLTGIPFMRVDSATLAIARHWLAPLKAVGDLDFLAVEMRVQESNAKYSLRILLQHEPDWPIITGSL